MKLTTFLQLLRINQWYKNLVIYLALIFSNLLFDGRLFLLTTIGLLSLCLISSTNYIINDIIDKKRDLKHPEKKLRPVASGKISVKTALFIGAIILSLSLLIAYKISIIFLISIVGLFILTLFYSIYLKNIVLLDIILVSANFVIRAISGTFIINRILSPWLILCPFFLALFLIVGKREADIKILGSNAFKHKEVLKYYTPEINNILMIISTTLLITSYSLYAFLGEHKNLLLTLPFAIYVILRYLYLIYSGSEIARKPNLIYKDRALMIGILLWIIAIFFMLYLNFNTYQIIYPNLSS